MKYRVKRHAVDQPPDTSYRLIPLTQGQNAIVDAEDFERLSQWNWCAHWSATSKSFYAVRRGAGHYVSMQSYLLGVEEGVDHKNHDTLDNRKNNIRQATPTQNLRNRAKFHNNKSGFKGVSLHKGKWRVRIMFRGKYMHIGCFDDVKEAAKSYDDAARIYFGEFAHLNFPD